MSRILCSNCGLDSTRLAHKSIFPTSMPPVRTGSPSLQIDFDVTCALQHEERRIVASCSCSCSEQVALCNMLKALCIAKIYHNLDGNTTRSKRSLLIRRFNLQEHIPHVNILRICSSQMGPKPTLKLSCSPLFLSRKTFTAINV